MTPTARRSTVERVVDAVLYEGYILYPYRPSSVKNRQRWTFGGVYPRESSRAQAGSDPWSLQAECLVIGGERTTLDIAVRFLQLVDRSVGQLPEPIAAWPPHGEPPFRLVDALQVGERVLMPWQEAVVREIGLHTLALGDLATAECRREFGFPASRNMEPVAVPSGLIAGLLLRRQSAIDGTINVRAARVADELYKVTVRVENVTAPDPAPAGAPVSRDAASLQALVSAHLILEVHDGAFVSSLDPPERYRQAAAACRNVGVWPVLVGPAGSHDTMLASPIILYDYPEVAAESPGDLFDGTEIDEILTLRILAMTDAEKQEMRDTDERARALLERTERLSPEQLGRLHGVMRDPHPFEVKLP